MISFTIPGDPVGKGRPRMTRGGHVYTPAKTRNAEAHVKLLAGQAMAGAAPIAGPVRVEIKVSCRVPDSWNKAKRAQAKANVIRPGKPDLDNVVKMILDALNGVVVVDDKQVCVIRAVKVFAPVAETTVEVEETICLVAVAT